MYAIRSYYEALLQAVLAYHVVPGRVSASDLVAKIQDNGGSASLETVQGGTLTASLDGKNVILRITSYNVCYTKLLRSSPTFGPMRLKAATIGQPLSAASLAIIEPYWPTP